MNGGGLRAATVDEAVAVENYKNASKESLAAANAVADKIVTAAFSFATAYGAVIALVAPEETPAPVVAAIPFALFALAVGIALYAQSRGIDLAGSAEVSALRDAVNDVIKAKRFWSRLALVALVLGVFLAGVIVRDKYAEPAKADSSLAVQVWLTPAGSHFVESACRAEATTKIRGTVENAEALSETRVGLKVTTSTCPAGDGTLYLSPRLIDGVKQLQVGSSSGKV